LKKNVFIDPVWTGEREEQLGRIALEYGITLCFENVHWAAFNYPDFFRQMKDYCPSVGAVLDIKQAWQSGYPWEEYLDAMGDRLRNVHLCDHIGDKLCMTGKGEFPFGRLIEKLKKVNYGGSLIIEQYSGNYESTDEIKQSVEYIKNLCHN
jgi:sugar phosphate isomerase/epimerase